MQYTQMGIMFYMTCSFAQYSYNLLVQAFKKCLAEAALGTAVKLPSGLMVAYYLGIMPMLLHIVAEGSTLINQMGFYNASLNFNTCLCFLVQADKKAHAAMSARKTHDFMTAHAAAAVTPAGQCYLIRMIWFMMRPHTTTSETTDPEIGISLKILG